MVAPGRKPVSDGVQDDPLCSAAPCQGGGLLPLWEAHQGQDTPCWLLEDGVTLSSPEDVIGDLSSPALSCLPPREELPDDTLSTCHNDAVASAMQLLTEAQQEEDIVQACGAVKAVLCSEYEAVCHAASCALLGTRPLQEVPCAVDGAAPESPLQHLVLLLQRCSSTEAARSACELLHSLLAPHQRPKTRGCAVSLLLRLRTPDVLVRCLQRLLPPQSSASADSLALSGCQVITKLLAKDPRGPVRLRLVGGVSLVLRLVQERLGRRPLPPLLPLLILLCLAAKNGSNQQLLGREGAVRTLVSLLSSASKKQLTKIKYILETLASLAASKSCAVECACYGAVGASVSALQGWRTIEPRLLNKLMRAAVTLFQRTADTKEGRLVVSGEGALSFLQDFILSSPDHRSLDTSVCAAVTFFLKCSQETPQQIYPANASPLIVFRPPSPGGPLTGVVDVNFPSSSGADVIQTSELDDAGHDEEEDPGDEALMDDEEGKYVNEFEFREEGRLKDDYPLTPCDDYNTVANSSAHKLPLPELLSYRRFCPELSGASSVDLSFWRSVSVLTKDGGGPSCAASPLPVSWVTTSSTIASTSAPPTSLPTSPTTAPPTSHNSSPTTVTTPTGASVSELYSKFAESTRSLLPFVKIAYPDLVGGVSPRHLEPLHVRDPRLARTRGVQRVERQLRGHVLQRVVYDLDALLLAHCSQQLITPSAAPPHRSLGNWDEKRVGRRDVSSRSLNFESRFEGGNLRRAVQVDDREYELVVRSDISSTHHHQWFYFEVSNMEAGAPYVFSIINSEKQTSEYNAGMRPLLFSVREAMHGRCHWVRTGTNIVYHKNHYRRSPYHVTHVGGPGDAGGDVGVHHPTKKATSRSGQTGLSYFTASFTIVFPHAYDVCYLAYLYPYSYTRLKSFLSTVEENVPADVFYSCQTLCHSLNGNPVPVLTITSKDTLPSSDVHCDLTETEKNGVESPFIGEGCIEASSTASDKSYEPSDEPFTVAGCVAGGEAKARLKFQRPVDFGQDLKCNLNRPRTEDETKHSTLNSLDCDSSRNNRSSNFDISIVSGSNNREVCDSNNGDTMLRRPEKPGNTQPCDTSVVKTPYGTKVAAAHVEAVPDGGGCGPLPEDEGVSDACDGLVAMDRVGFDIGDGDTGSPDRNGGSVGDNAVAGSGAGEGVEGADSAPSSCYSTPTCEILYSDLFSEDGSSKFSFVKPSVGKKTIKPGKAQAKPDKAQAKRDKAQAKRDKAQAKRDKAQVKPDKTQAEPDEAQAEPDKSGIKSKRIKKSTCGSEVATADGTAERRGADSLVLCHATCGDTCTDPHLSPGHHNADHHHVNPQHDDHQHDDHHHADHHPSKGSIFADEGPTLTTSPEGREGPDFKTSSAVEDMWAKLIGGQCAGADRTDTVNGTSNITDTDDRTDTGDRTDTDDRTDTGDRTCQDSGAPWSGFGSPAGEEGERRKRSAVPQSKPVVFLSSRVHPGESNASWLMEGSVRWLMSQEAAPLRRRCVVKIVPMLNVEGVIHGNTRCGLTGEDLNRRWHLPCPTLHPSIYHTKALLEYITRVLGSPDAGRSATKPFTTAHSPQTSPTQGTPSTISSGNHLPHAGAVWSPAEDPSPLRPPPCHNESHHLPESQGTLGRCQDDRTSSKFQHQQEEGQQVQEKQPQEEQQLRSGVAVYCDYHGHSRQKNLFLYGCSRQLSWWPEDGGLPDHPHLTRLPALCQEMVSCFSGAHCCYSVERARESTARVAVWRQYGVACSYTLEASASGCDQGVYQGYHLGTHQLVEAGAQFCEALHQLLCPAPAAAPELHLEHAALHHARIRRPEGLVRKGKTADVAVHKVSSHSDTLTKAAETEDSLSTSASSPHVNSMLAPASSGHLVSLPPPSKRGGSVKPKTGRAKKTYVGKKKTSKSVPLSASESVVSAPKPLSVGPSFTAMLKLERSLKRESDSEAELDRDLYCCNESDDLA